MKWRETLVQWLDCKLRITPASGPHVSSCLLPWKWNLASDSSLAEDPVFILAPLSSCAFTMISWRHNIPSPFCALLHYSVPQSRLGPVCFSDHCGLKPGGIFFFCCVFHLLVNFSSLVTGVLTSSGDECQIAHREISPRLHDELTWSFLCRVCNHPRAPIKPFQHWQFTHHSLSPLLHPCYYLPRWIRAMTVVEQNATPFCTIHVAQSGRLKVLHLFSFPLMTISFTFWVSRTHTKKK